MEKVVEIFNLVVGNYQVILTALVGIFTGVIAIAMLIPGEQPEKALKAIVAFIEKFSKK